jgi:hypothetical protein
LNPQDAVEKKAPEDCARGRRKITQDLAPKKTNICLYHSMFKTRTIYMLDKNKCENRVVIKRIC